MKTRFIMLALISALGLSCSDDDNKQSESAPVEAVNNSSVPIPDAAPSTPLTSVINIDADGVISRPELVSISVELSHTFAGDITVELIAPNGQSIPLIKRLGAMNTINYGISANFNEGNQLVFNSANEMPLPSANLLTTDVIPAGDYKPTGDDGAAPISLLMLDMANFLNGKSVNGAWSLRVADYSVADLGNLVSWKIKFGQGALN